MIKVDGKEIQFSKFPNGETLVDMTLEEIRSRLK